MQRERIAYFATSAMLSEAVDTEYWLYALRRRPPFLTTSPVDPGDVVRFRQGDTSIARTVQRLDRSELVCISKFG